MATGIDDSVYPPLKKSIPPSIACNRAIQLTIPAAYYPSGPCKLSDARIFPGNHAEKVISMLMLLLNAAHKAKCTDVYVEELCNATLVDITTDESIRHTSIDGYRFWFLLSKAHLYAMCAAVQELLSPEEPASKKRKTTKSDTAFSSAQTFAPLPIESMSGLKDALLSYTAGHGDVIPHILTFDFVDTSDGADDISMELYSTEDDVAQAIPSSSHEIMLPENHVFRCLCPAFGPVEARRMVDIIPEQRDCRSYITEDGFQFPEHVLKATLVTPIGGIPISQLSRTLKPDYEVPTNTLIDSVVQSEICAGGVPGQRLPTMRKPLLEMFAQKQLLDPARGGGMKTIPLHLKSLSPGEQIGIRLFWNQYHVRSDILRYRKLRSRLGDDMTDTLTIRRINETFSMKQDGVVETYAAVRSYLRYALVDIRSDSLCQDITTELSDLDQIASEHGVKQMSYHTFLKIRQTQLAHDNLKLTRAQTFCVIFMYTTLGRLGHHAFGAQIFCALLGGPGIGKSRILRMLEMLVPEILVCTSGSSSGSRLARLKTECNKVTFSDDHNSDEKNDHMRRSELSMSSIEYSRQRYNQTTGEWTSEELTYVRMVCNFLATNERFSPQMFDRLIPLFFLNRTATAGLTTSDLVMCPDNEDRRSSTALHFKTSVALTFVFWEQECAGAFKINKTLYYVFAAILRGNFREHFGEHNWKRYFFSSRVLQHVIEISMGSMAFRLAEEWAYHCPAPEDTDENRLIYYQTNAVISYTDLINAFAQVSFACEDASERNDVLAAIKDAVMMHIGNLEPLAANDTYYETGITDKDERAMAEALLPYLHNKVSGVGLIEQVLQTLKAEPYSPGNPMIRNGTGKTKTIEVHKEAVLEAVTESEEKYWRALAELYVRAFEGDQSFKKVFIDWDEEHVIYDSDILYALRDPSTNPDWGVPVHVRNMSKSLAVRTMTFMQLRRDRSLQYRSADQPKLDATVCQVFRSESVPILSPGSVAVGSGLLQAAKRLEAGKYHKTPFKLPSGILRVAYRSLKPYIDQEIDGVAVSLRTAPSAPAVNKSIQEFAVICGARDGEGIFAGVNAGTEKNLCNVITIQRSEFSTTLLHPGRRKQYTGPGSEAYEGAEDSLIPFTEDGLMTLYSDAELYRKVLEYQASAHRVTVPDWCKPASIIAHAYLK